jgi:C1A family cysteine protease
MKRKFGISLILLLCVFISGSLFSTKTDEGIMPVPLSPEYIKYLQAVDQGTWNRTTSEGFFLGEIPSPVAQGYHGFMVDPKVLNNAPPASYDLRTANHVTTVKDQGSCGSCWSFATYGSLESNVLKQLQYPEATAPSSPNYAEQHLIDNHGYIYGPCEGGHHYMSTGYLTRGAGPHDEASFPYSYSTNGTEGSDGTVQRTVRNITWLPDDADTLKYYIMNYGAAHISFYSSGSYYNPTTYAHYTNATTSTNHAVTCVGWDDSFSASNFLTTPAGDGAWIIKNSWDSTWGDSGYLYISYYSTDFFPRAVYHYNTDTSASAELEGAAQYAYRYEHDPYSWTLYNYGSSSSNIGYGANIFTAAGDHQIKALSLIIDMAGTQIEYWMYKDLSSGTDPKSGTVAANGTKTFTYGGYYTVPFEGVNVTDGSLFSIVVKYTVPSGGYVAPIEYYNGDYCTNVTASAGESFFSSSGSSWTDLGAMGVNCTIKAFGDDQGAGFPQYHLLGSWAGQGTYYRDAGGTWHKLATAASKVCAGGLDSDSVHDLIGIWPSQGGVWAKYSGTGSWAQLSSTADWISAGDMNGDGRDDLLATYTGQGVYYKDSIGGTWTQMASPATQVCAGDVDGDGTDDLIGMWPSQGGVWVKYGGSGTWEQISSTADWIAAGDMNGDGRDDLLGAWTGQGSYYRDSATGSWIKVGTAASMITAGDMDADGTFDLVGIWPSQGGVWTKYSGTGTWAQLSSTADWIGCGCMEAPASSAIMPGMIWTLDRFSPFMEGPKNLTTYDDLSPDGPGGIRFSPEVQEDLDPHGKTKAIGPGDPGFTCREEKNLIPREGTKKQVKKDKEKIR